MVCCPLLKVGACSASLLLQREWSYFAQAEDAERQRRQVVERVKPVAMTAEEVESRALRTRQLAQETEHHARASSVVHFRGFAL